MFIKSMLQLIQHEKKGFTLLELLLVIAIISVLAGLVIFNLRPADVLNNTKNAKNASNSKDIKKAIETYALDHDGNLPASLAGQPSGDYNICKQSEPSCPIGSISLDELVTGGYLSVIPVNESKAGTKTTGFVIEYDAAKKQAEIIAREEVVVLYGNFANGVDKTTGSLPYSVAIGDLNGDGKADLAVANEGSGSVSTFMNNGNGTFANKVDKTTGAAPRSVAIGDLNGDGKADLAVANWNSNSVSILMNNGDGTFADKVDKTTGTNPKSVAIGNLNGDGKADLAVANRNSDSVSIFMNNGDGTFADKVDKTNGAAPHSIAIGDLNGDGKFDLAVANENSLSVSTLMNNGDGTFADQVNKATGYWPNGVAIGDLNGDGKADLAVGSHYPEVVNTFMNNGDGTFADKVDYATGSGSYPILVAIGDLNGDGKADLAVADWDLDFVSTFMNNGDGTFAGKVDYPTGWNTRPYSVAIGDLNGDGKADLAVAKWNFNAVSVFINQPQL